MRLKLNFDLVFESDWHINAGFGEAGKADAVIERDMEKRPIISGATLKGVFRDALYDLAINLGLPPESVTGILDHRHQADIWRFGAASPNQLAHDSVIATGVRVDPRYRRAEDNKFFVRELGAADVYHFEVIGSPNDDRALEQVEWLVAAAAYIQRLGGRRRRGNGTCRIMLRDHDQAMHYRILNNFAVRHCNEEGEFDNSVLETLKLFSNWVLSEAGTTTNPSHRYQILLKTLRPVVIAVKPEAGNVYQGLTYIPGQTLRGAFAELAHPGELQVHDTSAYQVFINLFVLGGLKFSHLQRLSVDEVTHMGIPAAALPLGLQRIEDKEGEFTSVFQKVTKEKAAVGWVTLSDQRKSAPLATQPHPHVKINPDLKRASDGDLYTYEAIPAGELFIGEMVLSDTNWSDVANLLKVNLETSFEIILGKGRNRSYGVCEVIVRSLTDTTPPSWIHHALEKRYEFSQENGELLITLSSDSIVQDPWGRFYGKFERAWLEPLFGEGIRLTNDWGNPDPISPEMPEQVTRTKVIASFDARSGLPRWQDKAIVAGSTARLKFADGKFPSLDTLKALETNGIGLRRGEGYGRVIFNHPAHTGWEGFDEPIALPSAWFNTASQVLTTKEFTDTWRAEIATLHTDFDSKAARSIAVRLMQGLGMTPDDLLNDMRYHASGDKKSILKYRALSDQIVDLLEKLQTHYPVYWRNGVVLLAEALLQNRENNHA